jgi:hypothetical protein
MPPQGGLAAAFPPLSAVHSSVKIEKVLGSFLGRNGLYASIQTALVTAGGVLMQNTLLHALVEHRNGLAVSLTQRCSVALGDRPTQRAQRSTQLALVGAVHRGLGLCLTCALQRGNMICHKLSSLNPYMCRGKWGAGRRSDTRPAKSQRATLPATSKSTELQANGQPGKYPIFVTNAMILSRFPQPKRRYHLALDAKLTTFYSLPIFDTRLAPPAIPVVVRERSHRAVRRSQPQQPLPHLPCLIKQQQLLNPASSDGGQHTT